MHIRMKPAEAAPEGWVAKLIQQGFKVSSGSRAFGRTSWVVKRFGQAVEAIQDPHTMLATPLAPLTAEQHEIVSAWASTGVCALVPRRNALAAHHG